MATRQITWTDKQKEIAELLRGGASRQEIMAKGHSKTAVSRVATTIKAELDEKRKQAGPEGKPQAEAVPSTLGETKIRGRTLDPVVVGEFIIEPADWRLNQYGGFLVLNTYEWARQKFGYTGTVGDFICDSCQIMRLIMGLDMVSTEYLIKPKEDDHNGRGEQASQGTSVPANAGEENGGGSKPG